jgi:peptide/nickel transport system ATP-binding protein
MIVRLVNPTKGKILFENQDITFLPDKALKSIRQKMQIIFQDPYDSLNPQMTIFNIVAEPVQSLGLASGSDLEERVRKALEDVELTPPEEFILRFPHELSGGQRQRVATARALIVNPEFIIADEPVSMLDVSIRAEVLNVMLQLMEKRNVSFFYITHDLALARHICTRIGVMYLGKMMERADAEGLIKEPLHPYTKALIAAVPIPDPASKRADVVIKGEIPSPVNPPSGCRFHTRCPDYMGDICKTQEPLMTEIGNRHFVACHLYTKH